MSLTGKQTPLSLNVIASLLQDTGLTVGETTKNYIGTSSLDGQSYNYGTIVGNTVLNNLLPATIIAYTKIGNGVSQGTYNNLVSIGSNTIPALGNSKPSTYTRSYTGADTRFGFLRTIAVQANKELRPTDGTGTLATFTSTFVAAQNYVNNNNKIINSFLNSSSFLEGTYSNMDDLTTSDVSGVSLSTLYWGQDLINTGRAIDLKKIARFGNPVDLLSTLKTNNAFTKAVSLALLACDLTSVEILNLLTENSGSTIQQQKKVYAAFKMIMGVDLKDILVPLNCQTQGLTTLADLLDPKKLFPNSYQTLTTPVYNVTPQPTNSKTYYPIYKDGGVNSQLNTLAARLRSVMPEDIAIACEAFSIAMRNIKNISNMNIEKFSQVVTNIETMKDLDVNGNTVPTDQTLASQALAQIAVGTGPDGSHTMYDFFGSLVGDSKLFSEIQAGIQGIQTTQLDTILYNIRVLLSGFGPYDSLQTLINDANAEIASILSSNTSKANELNILWDTLGTNLMKEMDLRDEVLSNLEVGSKSDIYSFVNSMPIYAKDTELKFSADVLEKIADTTTMGGRSLIGLMRETRNAYRLSLTGGSLDNDISDVSPNTTVNNYTGLPKITGKAIPGSLSGSPEVDLIPPELQVFNQDPKAISPSTYSPNEAVDQVLTCNCDCWDNL